MNNIHLTSKLKYIGHLLVLGVLFISGISVVHAEEQPILQTYINAGDGGFADPSKANNQGYFQWDQCWDQKFDNQPIGPDNVQGIPAPCRPDTLYSWGGPQKGAELERLAADGKPWTSDFQLEMFSHINPVATFGYGPIAFRFKLKASTRFYLYTANALDSDHLCTSLLNEAQRKDTVIVRTWTNDAGSDGVDYIFCSPEILESWSMDTRTHFDEIVASQRWNDMELSKNSNNWIPYIYTNSQAELFDTDLDSKNWSFDYLNKNLVAMKQRALANKGEIHYNPDAGAVVKGNIVRHFSTTHPIYWNPGHPKPEL